MSVNIDEYRFDRHEARKFIPNLTDKTFKNWSEEGLVDFQIRRNTRLLSPLGVVKLAAMHAAVTAGMRPPAAAAIAEKIAPRIYELWEGLPNFPDAKDRKVLPLAEKGELPFFRVEVDALIGIMFERILKHVSKGSRRK